MTPPAGAPFCAGHPPAPLGGGGMHPALVDPWQAALGMPEGTVLAVLTRTEGPAYREIGAAMAIAPDGRYAGAITSGCIEADLVLQAARVRAGSGPIVLRYGEGSPFFDLKLPCGGALEVTLSLLQDRSVLQSLSQARAMRRPVAVQFDHHARLSLRDWSMTGPCEEGFEIGFRPALRHVILGAGPEALSFAKLVAGMGRPHLLLSHDEMVLSSASALGCTARRLSGIADLALAGIDADTAVTLFYHDHDIEPQLLRPLLQGPAVYIGAQGSRAAHRVRVQRLREMGVSEPQIARLQSPIGMIHSARDPQTLAISVLAEIAARLHAQPAYAVVP